LNKNRRRRKRISALLNGEMAEEGEKYYADISFIFHIPIMTVSARLLPSLFHPFLLTSSSRPLVCFPSELNCNY
jgi:hypothetical protein